MAAPVISHGKTNYLSNPVGIDTKSPVFTWVYTFDNAEALSAEIRVCVYLGGNIWWDSGYIGADVTSVEYTGKALLPRTRYTWTARTRLAGKPETEALSEEYSFDTGLMGIETQAKWIRADDDDDAPVLERSFTLDSVPVRAMTYVSGLGLFHLYVNGIRVGNEALRPVLCAYSKQPLTNMRYPFVYKGAYRVPYLTYDIAPFLRAGKNTISVHIANGWYHQTYRLVEGDLWYGDSPVLLLEAHIGDTVVATDESWTWHKSSILKSQLFLGEVVDLRVKDDKKRPVRFAPAPLGRLCAQKCASDGILREYSACISYGGDKNSVILDFAQNMTGWVKANVSALSGDRLLLRFSEEIQSDENGVHMDFASTGARSRGGDPDFQIQRDEFIFAGNGVESVSPTFVWHGFRFAEAALIRNGAPVALAFENGSLVGENFRAELTAEMIATDIPETGHFACSNDMLNWFHKATVMSMRGNQHLGVPLDCPHRERLGYTGDGQISASAILTNLDSTAFELKWLDDILDAQNRETGHVPHTAPFYNGGGGPGGWGGSIVFLPWQIYKHTGDKSVLKTAWQPMLKWIDYLDTRSENGIVVREEEGGWCLGDWCMPYTEAPEPALVNTALTIEMLNKMILCADILGEAEASEMLKAKRAARKAAFTEKYLNTDAIKVCGSEALALYAGIPNGKAYADMLKSLLGGIEAREHHFDTGIFGTPILLSVLSENGCLEDAYKLMTSVGYPSFDYMRQSGATTLWERWSGDSHNHVMFGAADTWLYERIAGIRQAEDSCGWKSIVLEPGLPNEISRAEAALQTPLGRAGIAWKKENGRLHVEVEIPALSNAVMRLPSGESVSVAPGMHEYDFDISKKA